MNLEPNTDLPWDLVAHATGGLAIGIVLQGTYRIIRPLAEGGCGEVYLAAHTRLPGRFAVKLLHRSLARDNDALERFRQEAEITSSLRHPHIVQVFDFNVTDNGVPFLVMELLEGKLLSERVQKVGAIDPIAAANIIEQIAGALHAAHTRGIVHRDLKPENVMLLAGAGVDDFVKVMDFGISQASWRPRLTEGERVAGTPQYMAPEQAQGLREQIDHRSDQFSLAAIAYTLLTGPGAVPRREPDRRALRGRPQRSACCRRSWCRRWARRSTPWSCAGSPRSRPTDTRTCSRSPARCARRSRGRHPAPFVDVISEPPPVRVGVAPARPPSRRSRFARCRPRRRRASRWTSRKRRCGRPGTTPSG